MRGNNQTKECVDGVRRVWGTMKVTISTSLYSVITKPSNIENKSKLSNVEIKSMNIMNSDGGLQGGGHAPESVLKCLDSEWEAIKMHTGWKLEPCFKPLIMHLLLMIPLLLKFLMLMKLMMLCICLPPLIIQFTHQTITSTDASCLPPLIIQFLQRMLHVKVTILIMIQLQLLFWKCKL